MKQLLLLITFSFIVAFASAQTPFELPQNIQLKEKEDYAKYDSTIIKAAKWLEETDIDQQPAKHRQVNAFVMKWVQGSPSVNVDINETLAGLSGNNDQLLVIYLASYSKYVLENKNTFSRFAASKAGLLSMMKVYKKGIYIMPTREMDKVIHMSSSELDNYILDRFTNTTQA